MSDQTESMSSEPPANQDKDKGLMGPPRPSPQPGPSRERRSTTSSQKTDVDKDYDSEPSVGKHESKRRLRPRYNQGKAFHPKAHNESRELRELRRNHAMLEKNLKIEGLPEPPKMRKRRNSVGSSQGRPTDKDFAFKRRRLGSVDHRPKKDHMPKWELIGGDAGDPLNLNGLANSEEGRLLNMKTPESSPLPTPDFRKVVYVKVPPNIEDPLNLEGRHDQRVIDRMLDAPIKKRHRRKKHDVGKRDKKKGEGKSETPNGTSMHDEAMKSPDASMSDSSNPNSAEKIQPIDLKHDSSAETPTKNDTAQMQKDNLPTPSEQTPTKGTPTKALPSPAKATTSRRSSSRSISRSPDRLFKRQISGGKGKGVPHEPQKYPEKPMFTLGNYNRYYGYRNRNNTPDPRLEHFNRAWFKGKDVLDIGCNVGHITLALAEQFHPHKILGIDIDGKLIQAARQNIRHMLSMRRKDSFKYPSVFEMTRGSLEAHPLMGSSDQFPNNVLFLQGNYVPGSEEILNLVKEEYDTILALSITKWIHLNNGDFGLKLFFQKIFRQLRPGGRLILEPQPWSTYRKRAKLTPDMFKNYQSIKLKPEGFKHYLLSIGFAKCEVIAVPVAKAKGFRRPLILFTKSDNKQSSSEDPREMHVTEDGVCVECGSSDPSRCFHEFAGVRHGAYASFLYDHVNYPRDYSDHGQRFADYHMGAPYGDGYDGGGPWGGMGMGGFYTSDIYTVNRSSSRLSSPSYKFTEYSEMRSSSVNGSVSGSSCSTSGSTASGSSSGSSSSRTTGSSSDHYMSPAIGPNGDIAHGPDFGDGNGDYNFLEPGQLGEGNIHVNGGDAGQNGGGSLGFDVNMISGGDSEVGERTSGESVEAMDQSIPTEQEGGLAEQVSRSTGQYDVSVVQSDSSEATSSLTTDSSSLTEEERSGPSEQSSGSGQDCSSMSRTDSCGEMASGSVAEDHSQSGAEISVSNSNVENTSAIGSVETKIGMSSCDDSAVQASQIENPSDIFSTSSAQQGTISNPTSPSGVGGYPGVATQIESNRTDSDSVGNVSEGPIISTVHIAQVSERTDDHSSLSQTIVAESDLQTVVASVSSSDVVLGNETNLRPSTEQTEAESKASIEDK